MKNFAGSNRIISTENFFYLVIFCLPLYLYRISILGLPTNIFEILAILSILFFFIEKRRSFAKKFKTLPKFVLIAISFIIIGVFMSIFFSNAYAAGFAILKSWFLIPIFFSYMLYAFLNSETAVEKVFASIYASVVLVGIIGIVYKIAGIVTYDGRLEAFYLSPNYLSMFLAPGIFFGTYFLTKSLKNKASICNSAIHLVSLIFVLIPFYYTYSYGAWLAVCLSILALIMLSINKKRLLIVSLFGAIAVTVFFFQADNQKFSNLFSERSSSASRMMIWNASRLMIKQHPILGIGPGNFQSEYLLLQKYFPPYLEWAVPEPHNLFLAFWIQTGVLGLIGFLLLLFFIFRFLLAALKNKKGAALAAPVLGFFTYTILHGFIDTPYWKNDLSFLFWICVFLTLSIYNISKSEA